MAGEKQIGQLLIAIPVRKARPICAGVHKMNVRRMQIRRRRDEANQQERLQAEAPDKNRDRDRPDDVAKRQSSGEDTENSFVEVKIGEIEVEEEEEKTKAEIVQEGRREKSPETAAEPTDKRSEFANEPLEASASAR